ncbi:MAG: hypothetical protein ACOX3H_04610 [Saccharofermentanales bacterium]|jgi:hypothetical protein
MKPRKQASETAQAIMMWIGVPLAVFGGIFLFFLKIYLVIGLFVLGFFVGMLKGLLKRK